MEKGSEAQLKKACSLVESSVPYKTKKQTLAQEGGGFIQDLLIPVLTSIGPLML